MKRIMTVAGATLVFCTSAYAQSSVTLYGLIDEAIRYQSNSSTSTHSVVEMADGAVNGNRWGLKGSEDLGGGLQAIFDLEAGYSMNTGAIEQGGLLFGRQAWVGLQSNTYGSLKLGREYGSVYQMGFIFDPIGNGDQTSVDWQSLLMGIRYDSTAEYDKSFGPVAFQFQHSFGGGAGDAADGSTNQGSLVYHFGAGNLGIGGGQSQDTLGNDKSLFLLGANYNIGPVGLYAYGLLSHKDAGYLGTGSGDALGTDSDYANSGNTRSRTDRVGHFGVSYQPAPNWKFIVGYIFDSARNVDSAGQSGTASTAFGIADYILSKRTDIYLELDSSHLGGAEVSEDPNPVLHFDGQSHDFGGSLSLRTVF